MPGGVNSPVRAFGGVGGTPRVIERARGSRVWDVDGTELGSHDGAYAFTVGQRRGLRLGRPAPLSWASPPMYS